MATQRTPAHTTAAIPARTEQLRPKAGMQAECLCGSRDCVAWRQIRRSAEVSETKAALGQVEDSIDAVARAHIAGQVRVLGTTLSTATPLAGCPLLWAHRPGQTTPHQTWRTWLID